MIKKIKTEQLRAGMYIHDLNCAWMDHGFMMNRLAVRSEWQLKKVQNIGVAEVYIDTEKGLDEESAIAERVVKEEIEQKLLNTIAEAPAKKKERVPKTFFIGNPSTLQAKTVQKQAVKVVKDVLLDARLGHQVNVEKVEVVVEQVTQFIFQNSDALLALCRIKNKDTYTFEHCVSVCALMVSFARTMDMDMEEIRDVGIGGLLHDIGKMKIPDEILNKPGKLSEQEFEIMQTHPELGRQLLHSSGNLSPTVIQICSQHHERYDGKGYPERFQGNQISILGQMASVVDVYDAITSNRVYHRALPPHEAIRKIYEWGNQNFDRNLVESFIRVVGIYPVGSVVNLTNDKAGVVIKHRCEDLLRPIVRIIFDCKKNIRTPMYILDLADVKSQERQESILGVNENLAMELKINPMDFVQV